MEMSVPLREPAAVFSGKEPLELDSLEDGWAKLDTFTRLIPSPVLRLIC
jgi:hypothetical protein